MQRRIRTFEPADIDLMIRYFHTADVAFLRGMGVDPNQLPDPDSWRQLLLKDFEQPLDQRQFYYVLWEIDQVPVGHSNINRLVYGEAAWMHLHLWSPSVRGRGHGTAFVAASIARYFEELKLQMVYCEPYALNPAPNKTLPKVGFEFVQRYETKPGWLNFHQPVHRWVLTREKWLATMGDRGAEFR